MVCVFPKSLEVLSQSSRDTILFEKRKISKFWFWKILRTLLTFFVSTADGKRKRIKAREIFESSALERLEKRRQKIDRVVLISS